MTLRAKEEMHSVLSLNEDDLIEVLKAANSWARALRHMAVKGADEAQQQEADRIDSAARRIRKQMFEADPS